MQFILNYLVKNVWCFVIEKIKLIYLNFRAKTFYEDITAIIDCKNIN